MTYGFVLLIGPVIIEVSLLTGRPHRVMAAGEVLPIFFAASTPALLKPRMWSWESRYRCGTLMVANAALALIAIIVPALIPCLAAPIALLEGYNYAAASSNILMVGAVAIVAGCLLGPQSAAPVALGAYITFMYWQQSTWSYSPIAPILTITSDASLHPGSMILMAAAITIQSFTLGRSRHAHNRTRHDKA